MKKQKGFTLIELLVVIAIIGILSSIVMASLNTARSKGNDAAVKADLNSVGTQAAIFLSNNNNVYGAFSVAACPAVGVTGTSVFHDSVVENAIAAALVNSGGGTATCASTNAAYAVSMSRPADVASTTSAYWCVDSTGEHCGIANAISGPSCGACVTTQ